MQIPPNLFTRVKAGYVLVFLGLICAIFSFFIPRINVWDYFLYIGSFFIGCVIVLIGVYYIFTKKPDERTLALFNQLKETKNCNSEGEPLVEINRGLLLCNIMPGFYCLPAFNRIFYNENSGKISDNAIRFSFLHEEGHFQEIQSNAIIGLFNQIVSMGILFTGFLSGISFLIFMSLITSGNFEKPEIIIVLIFAFIFFIIFFFLAISFFLIWLMTTRTFQTPLQMDEYSSDEYAAKALRDCFGVDKPSLYLKEVLEDIMKEFEKNFGKKRSFYQKMRFVFKGGTHPSINDRVEKIEKYIDKKNI